MNERLSFSGEKNLYSNRRHYSDTESCLEQRNQLTSSSLCMGDSLTFWLSLSLTREAGLHGQSKMATEESKDD